jgi:hypothetical protein
MKSSFNTTISPAALCVGSELTRVRAAATAAFRTVFHIIPAIGPFFTPGKGTLTNRTNFGG